MRRTRNSGLGAADDVHEAEAKRGVRDAYSALDRVDAAARKGACDKVWDHLIEARANVSHAYAHLESLSSSPQPLWHRFHEAQLRLLEARNTLGHQCTRSLGKRR